MARLPATAAVIVLACAVAIAPAASAAPGSAVAAAKCKKAKKKHRKRHGKRRGKRRCHAAIAPGTDAGISETAPGLPARLQVTEREVSSTELQLQLSRPSVPRGQVIVEQYNAGEDPHNLVVQKGDGSAVFTYPTLDPGLTQKQTLPLTQGSWTLYCSILDHQSLGMQATLVVN